MDANAGNDYEPPANWGTLKPGQAVQVKEAGHADGTGIIDNMTPDGAVVWVWITGTSPRRMFLAGDPVAILPEQETPAAF
ncbi:hypothetical protein ACFVTE_18530 [Arthrobacter sp. NPDC058097]|uniref:hypothetical protein n=1 Tax=Arthrobacter sp. NPDC058097 TaxID=3346340 RepID=UPI0036DF2AAD